VISTVASSLDLEEVLGSVVGLLSEASSVHACFVYLVEDDGERLVLRAASRPYGHLVGEIALERGEGLAWWVAQRHEPAFIRENALDDPRVKYVPQLEEERFQSLISVPIVAKDGTAIGVISMHTEAPREFSEEEVEFLVSSASLVAGAIENARLYAETQRRVTELERLTELGETIARAETHGELLPAVAERALALLGARSCVLYLLETGGEQLRLVASAPPDSGAVVLALGELGPELDRRRHSVKVSVPLVAGEELLGLLQAHGTAEVDVARAVASQTAVALKKMELIERLTEKNLSSSRAGARLATSASEPSGSAATSTRRTSSSQRARPTTTSRRRSPALRPDRSSTAETIRCARSSASRSPGRRGSWRRSGRPRPISRRRSRSASRTSVRAWPASPPASRRRATRSWGPPCCADRRA
jgi:GAF domain-containing protein